LTTLFSIINIKANIRPEGHKTFDYRRLDDHRGSLFSMKTTTPTDYVLLNHTADLGIKVFGCDLKDLFECAGRSLMSLMLKQDPPLKTSSMRISVAGGDLPDLMVRFLGEILYLFEGENLVVALIRVDSISPTQVEATLETVPFDPQIHEILSDIKAVTYHQIEVAEKGNRWEARVIFDI
jgi:SHS2 domain-containing protein